jgi:[ribosomal protein S5]-alanine N-acetyltransferase
MIITPRLTLIPASAADLQAELSSRKELEASLGARVPESWPPLYFDEDAVRYSLHAIATNPGTERWWFHYFILRGADGDTLIGAGGYKGPPADGCVEIGYSIVPEQQRRGLASEAASGLIAHAFSHQGVERVRAETLPELAGSIGVLRRCGFAFVGVGSEPGVIRYELTRAAWAGVPELSA